ncbi:MAG TPA: carbohydrate ABC transporter permease [Clostridia bacterium]|nr:carbohydrate ABC transporter permease [Clostridia bacterium]
MSYKMHNQTISKTKSITKTISYILLIIGSMIMAVPFIWLIRSSLMEPRQIFTFPPEWIPKPFVWSNYKNALKAAPFLIYLKNTMFIVVFVMGGTLLTSALSAYSFARFNWPGKKLMFYLLLSTMMLPYAVTLIPNFILWHWLGFTNTPVPLIVPAWFGGGAFNIFLLRQFFMTIPKELDEAALIDGANYFQIFFLILLPLMKPALAVVAIFTFMGTWNDFLGPLIYLGDSNKYTLAIGLAQFKGNYAAQWNYLMAASTVVILPIIVLFFVCQKYFVQGITLTGLKD